MLEISASAFRPLQPWEARGLAVLSRTCGTFNALLEAAVRAQFLRATAGVTFGLAAARGFELAESAAMLMLAAQAAADLRELDAKVAVLRPYASRSDGLAAGLVRDALDRDCRRLGQAAGGLDKTDHRPVAAGR